MPEFTNGVQDGKESKSLLETVIFKSEPGESSFFTHNILT
jgi:hypothetical protein